MLMVRRLKYVTNEIKAEFKTTFFKVMAGDKTAFSKGDRVAAALGAIGSMLFSSVATIYAEGDIIDAAQSALSSYYTKLVGITTLVAAFFILIAILWTMITPNSHGAQAPIAWIKRIIICWILILAFGGVVTLVQNLTKGMGFSAN